MLDVPLEVHDRRDVQAVPRRVRRSARCFHVAAGAVLPLSSEFASDVNHLLKPGTVILRGHQTDLLRAVFVAKRNRQRWKEFHWQIDKLLIVPRGQADEALYSRFMPEFKAWHRTLPESARAHAIDFMFLEANITPRLA